MKILFQLLDAGIGGGQRVAWEIARYLTERGDEIGLTVPKPGPMVTRFRDLGADVHFLCLTSLRRPSAVPEAARWISRYDLLYSHTAAPGQILGDIAARMARRPHVVHQHTFPYFSPRPVLGAVQRALYRETLSRRTFIAVAPHVKAGLTAVGTRPESIRVIPNGVSIPPSQHSARTSARLRVGMLGRFDPGKGMHTFVAAKRRIGSDLDAEFVIGGNSGPFSEYEVKTKREALDAGVTISAPGDSGEDFLRSLDVVVIPSRYEGCPLVLLEAMAQGKAIIGSDIPGIREVLGSTRAGILVPVEDERELADAICELVEHPEERARIGEQARATVVRDYRLDDAVGKVVEILDAATRW
jgi:glycosyltransferase involved in cell wall biosynthesis